ncbi:hypothetical protein CAEBREN_29186 [Caenorhabditis brenneri]|uniref:Uncharacterized protein n=1 Tax=Caenorhabditis brenneri TaxID=135651 RepID=G0NJ57_CAEBE|nr:hypothetical protein CAEBREN_29186 [Caenorhabditis brenneri]
MAEFAQFLLLCIAYHGFLSTCAMIIFTKPLRDKFFFCLKWINKTGDAIIQQPSIQFFTTVAASKAI